MNNRKTGMWIWFGLGSLVTVLFSFGTVVQIPAGLAQDNPPVETEVLPVEEDIASTQEEFSILDLVNECDLLAAHPEDPERMADGVADDDIVPRLAIMACEDAVLTEPDEPRFAFQLGRAFLTVGRKEKAKEQFERAAQQGYAAAEAYLGDFYQFGLGVKQDTNRALAQYRKAVAGEFKAAESQIEQLTFDPSQYVSHAIAEFYNGNFSAISNQSDKILDQLFRNYIYNFVVASMNNCERFLEPKSLVNFYRYRYPSDWAPEQEDSIQIAIQASVGESDSEVFIKRHGCEGQVAKQLFGNINKFFGAMYQGG